MHVTEYNISGLSFSCFENNQQQKFYQKDNYFVTPLDLKKYNIQLRQMERKAGNETPYFWCMGPHESKTLQARIAFGLFHYNEDLDLEGYTEAYIYAENPECAIFESSYINPSSRDKKLANLLYQARLDWAKNQTNIVSVSTHLNKNNLPSIKAAERFGFTVKPEDTVEKFWGFPSVKADCLHYQLQLDGIRP